MMAAKTAGGAIVISILGHSLLLLGKMFQQLLDGSAVLLGMVGLASRKDGTPYLRGLGFAERPPQDVVQRLVAVGERTVLPVCQPTGVVDGVEDDEELGLATLGDADFGVFLPSERITDNSYNR